MNENDLRDYLYANHRNNLTSLITERPTRSQSKKAGFPRISDILNARSERQIDRQIQRLQTLKLDGKEVTLNRDGDTTTRVDLLGHLDEDGSLVILELKKSSQTERQAFTQLLSYSNHFCTLFPMLSESNISLVLIAPMTGRSARDAFAQELIINGKNVLALVPYIENNVVSLSPYYPSSIYYRWIENNILDDRSFTVITASFPIIDGWIDSDRSGSIDPPLHTRDAFQSMTSIIAQEAENLGLHGFVYARQHWNELEQIISCPNTIVLCLINPFGLLFSGNFSGHVHGGTQESRLNSLRALVQQLEKSEDWLDDLYSSFRRQAIRLILQTFEELLKEEGKSAIVPEINSPDWKLFKQSMIESVYCHNLYPRLIGTTRYIYTEYIDHCYRCGEDEIYFYDDLPRFGYLAHDEFFAIWQILKGISEGDNKQQ